MGRCVILSDGATLIRPTVHARFGSPGKRKRHRGERKRLCRYFVGWRDAYPTYGPVRFGSPEKAQCAASGKIPKP
jgi:hypothetical protein